MNRLANLPFIGRDLETGEERIIGIVRLVGVDLYNVTIFNQYDTVWAEYNNDGDMVALGINIRF